VYVWNKTIDSIEQRLLVIRKTITKKNGLEIKFSFTNANLAQYTEECIAQMQSQRFFIEHNFKEAKQILGLDHYQTRKWKSWYHQVALNLMVGVFLLKEKILQKDEIPILSARDIRGCLKIIF